MDVGKQAHMLEWGWYQRIEDHWKIGNVSVGGAYRRIQDTGDINGEHLIKFGNDFGQGWIDHLSIPHMNWHFWDNPEIPHFLYPNPANPKGNKSWVRWVRGDIFSNEINTETGHVDRINDLLTDHAGHPMVWEELLQPLSVVKRNSKKILICPSTPNCYHYYYNQNRSEWIDKWSTWVERLGYEPVVKRKPTRADRNQNENNRLDTILRTDQYLATLSQHSAGAMESIIAGTPVIVTGPHPIGNLATTTEEFQQGILKTPDQDQVWRWIERVLSNVRHKSELFTGSWHQ